jgi:hypothetical protein
MKVSIYESQIKQHWIVRLILWITQWTFIENGAQDFLICLVIHVSPTWNKKSLIAPKHNNFFLTNPL